MKEAAKQGGLFDGHLSCVETLPKVVFSLLPMPLTEGMMPTPIAAEIRQYSIAVAAVSSRKNSLIFWRVKRVAYMAQPMEVRNE